MRGGHFVYGLCRVWSDKTALPNAAWCTEDEAQAELATMQKESPDEHWVIQSIWLIDEVDKSYGDIGGSRP